MMAESPRLNRAAVRIFWLRPTLFFSFAFLLFVGFVCGQMPNVIPGQLPASVLTKSDVANIDSAASRIANRIQEANLTESHPTVLVLDFFRDSPGTSSALGTLLADRFSSSLSSFAHDFSVLDRSVLGDYLTKNWMTLETLQSREVCVGLARDMGATGGPNYFRTAADIPTEPGVFQPGVQGVNTPTCIYCPDPQYSDAPRAGKIQGTLWLSVVVTENGTATSIYVLKGAPLGLTAQAIKAVQSWRFRPAQKDGKPVAVRTPIDVTFRLF